MQKLITIDQCEEMDCKQVWDLYRSYVNPGQVNIFSSFSFGRERFSHAEGMYMHTKDGKEILDFTGGLGVLNHGHNHPRILAARIAFQQKKLLEVHKIVFSPYVAALSHNIAQLLPGDLNKCFFPNSGAEAVEGALKLAYKGQKTTREHVLYSEVSFHGKLIGSGSISGSLREDADFPKMSGGVSFPFNDLEAVEKRMAELRRPDGNCNVYAIIIEPFSATTMTACTPEFLVGLRALCDREGVHLIFDEVFCGWGKCGELFYFMKSGVIPDILVMSKSFGGGKASISGIVTRDSLFDRAYGSNKDALLHTSTYNGFGEECVTALEAINIIVEDDYPARSRHIHERLNAGLHKLMEKYPKAIAEVRGAGSLNGILLYSPVELIMKALAAMPTPISNQKALINKVTSGAVMDMLYEKHDILTMIYENKDTVLLGATPSLIADDSEIDRYLESLDAVLDLGLLKVVGAFVAGKLKQMLGAKS